MAGQDLLVSLAEKAHGGERRVTDSQAPLVNLLYENTRGDIRGRGQATNQTALCGGAGARMCDRWAARAVQERRRG